MPPPSNSRKQLSHSQSSPPSGALPQQTRATGTRRPQRSERVEKPPPVAYFFPEANPPAPRLSAASITPIPPSVRQSTVTTISDLDDGVRPSPVAADRPPLPPFPPFQNPTGHPPQPTEAERYKLKILNRRTLPAPARSATFAAEATAHNSRPRTQSLGSASGSASSASNASNASNASTGELQRSTPGPGHYHYRKRRPSNPTLPAIVERPLPALPRRVVTTQDPRNPPSNLHIHFVTQPPKSAPHPTPSDPANIGDDLRPSMTSPLPQPLSASPTSTLVHGNSPLHEQYSSSKTPSKTRIKNINKNINKNLHKFFGRARSASVDCHDTATANPEQEQKRPTTPTPISTSTPNKFSSLPAITTSNISRPMVRRSVTTHTPTTRPRFRHTPELSVAATAVKRMRRRTPLTEVDEDSRKEWRSSFMNERKVPVYHPPAHSPYASNGHGR